MLPHLSLLTGQNVGMDGDRLQGRVFRVFESLDELVTTVEEARSYLAALVPQLRLRWQSWHATAGPSRDDSRP